MKDPITVKDKQLYFRGHNNTIQNLEYVKKTVDITEIKQFAVDGSSAGGVAVYTWLDYINTDLTSLNADLKVFGTPHSSILEDYYNVETKDYDYGIKMKATYELVNSPGY